MNPISLFRSNDPYEQLIQQMLLIESEPQERLKEQQKTQERLKTVINDVDSNLSALHTLVKSFTSALSNPFDAKAATVANTDAFTVSAANGAAYGSHTLEVLRLAKTDTRISKQMDKAGTELDAYFNTEGPQTFSIDVSHPTDADPNNRVSIDVTVDPVGTTDEEILKEIQTAINDAMDAAVEAGTIKKDEKVNASLVSETTSNVRLSLQSGHTGFTNRVGLTDSANGLLELIEVYNVDNNGNPILAAGTAGGAVHDVGTDETTSALNSMFELDGITLYRDGNSVDDALDDLTITLKKIGEGAVDFSVNPDKESIKGQVEEFITKYNSIITHLQAKAQVDGDSGVRGDLAGDSTFRSLRFNLRNDVTAQVSGQPTEGPLTIADLGIEVKEDGTLELDDVDELLAAVENDAGAVESLFAADDGIATRLKDRIDAFVGVKGIINDRIKSLDTKIGRLKNRIEDWDDRLTRREDSLRTRFAKMQETIAVLQGQQQNMSMFLGGF